MSGVAKSVKVSVFCRNGLGYALTLAAILFELAFSVKILDSIGVGVLMGVSCGLNIILLFVLFSVAVKENVYRTDWCLVGIACGAYALLRGFVLLPLVLKPVENQGMLFASTCVCGALVLAGALVSLVRSRRRAAFLATSEGRRLVGEED